jgi:hypothetical protein
MARPVRDEKSALTGLSMFGDPNGFLLQAYG